MTFMFLATDLILNRLYSFNKLNNDPNTCNITFVTQKF